MKPIFLFPFLFCISAASADQALTAAQAVREALAHNPAIQETQSRWNAARERVAQEAAWDDPQVSAMSRLARFVSVPRNGFADQTLSLSQSLPLAGRNLLRARAALDEALAVYEEARRMELDVASQTRAAFYQLANARAQLELNRQNLSLLQKMAGVTRAGYETGSQGASDVLAAQIEAGKLLESAQDLQRAAVAAQSQLNVLMGRDAFAPFGEIDSTQPKWPALPPDRLRRLLLAHRPEKSSLRNTSWPRKTARLELARRAWIPDPTLSIEGQRYNGAGQGISELDAGVSFNIPWANSAKYGAGAREAANKVAAAGHAADSACNEGLGLLRTTLADIETAGHHAHLSGGQLLTQARDRLQASEIAYQAGKASLADWIGAATALRELEAMQRQEQSNCAIALAQLEAVIGTSITP